MSNEEIKDCNTFDNVPKTDSMVRPQVDSVHFKKLPIVPFQSIKVDKILAKGHFSNVYKITHLHGKACNMILKRLSLQATNKRRLTTISDDNGPTFSSDLINEGKILSSLSHDNILGIQGWSGTTASSSSLSSIKNTAAAILNLPYLILDPIEKTLKDQNID